MSSIFSFDDVKDQESRMSKAGVWIVAIILFFSFFIAILCDLALLIIGTFLGVSEVNFPKELTDFENLQASENSALARKVKSYSISKADVIEVKFGNGFNKQADKQMHPMNKHFKPVLIEESAQKLDVKKKDEIDDMIMKL